MKMYVDWLQVVPLSFTLTIVPSYLKHGTTRIHTPSLLGTTGMTHFILKGLLYTVRNHLWPHYRTMSTDGHLCCGLHMWGP